MQKHGTRNDRDFRNAAAERVFATSAVSRGIYSARENANLRGVNGKACSLLQI